MDISAKATNRGHKTKVLVYFPEDTVASAPVKQEQAESIMENWNFFRWISVIFLDVVMNVMLPTRKRR